MNEMLRPWATEFAVEALRCVPLGVRAVNIENCRIAAVRVHRI